MDEAAVSHHEPWGSIILTGHLTPDEIGDALEPRIGFEYAYMVCDDWYHGWGRRAVQADCVECDAEGCYGYSDEGSQCWIVSREHNTSLAMAVTVQCAVKEEA